MNYGKDEPFGATDQPIVGNIVERSVKTVAEETHRDIIREASNHPLRLAWREYHGRIPNILNHGLLTSDTLVYAISTYQNLGKENLALFLDSNATTQLLSNGDFSNWLDPVSQLEVLKTGSLGTLLGMKVFSDFYLESPFQFIDGIQLKYKDNKDS